jgi:integrase
MPKKALTAASVKRVKPPAKGQVEIFDKGYPGLALRISYGGQKTWSAFYRLHGKLHRISLGTYPAMGLAEAREAWRQIRQDVTRGIDPAPAHKVERPATTFAAVAEEWLRRDQSGNRSLPTIRRIVDRELIPAWGNRPIQEISRRDILDLIDGIVDRGSPVMARRVQARLHRLFRWCVGRGIIAVNPVADLPKPGSEPKRDRVLTDDELVQVWKGTDVLGFPFGPAHQLLILTGARREEIGRLKWDEIDGDTIRLKGDRTKNGEPHDIPLSALARVLLEKLPRIVGSEFVFTAGGRKPVSAWSTAKARLDAAVLIAPWRIHDLRRTVATGCQRLGVGLQVVESILGHTAGSRAGVIKIYQRHNYADEKRSALEAWGAHVMALIEGKSTTNVVPMTLLG